MGVPGILLWGGLGVGLAAGSLEASANVFDYVAEARSTFTTRPVYEHAAEQSREWRDVTLLIAVVEVMGAGAVALIERQESQITAS